MARFPEHLQSARRKHALGLQDEPFYSVMCNTGMHNWAIVPLEVCFSQAHCLRREKHWMRKMGRVFNRQGVRFKYGGGKW